MKMKSNSYQTSSMAKRRQAQKSIDGNSKTANKHGTAIIADKGKVDAVNKTFQKEEAKQLESFIKKRSKELDEEIYRLTNKLNIGTTTEKDGTTGNSANGVSASSRSLPRGSLSDSHISDHSLELSGTQLSMQDRRELQEFYRINKTDNGDSTKSRSIRFEDEENLALTNVKMNKSNSPTRGRLAPAPEPLLDSNAILINTLARLKLHMEDAQMSGAELKEWFLPSDLELPGETCISVQELIGVLSSELGMTLTKRDLDMLLQFYGTKQGDVDVIQMLVDAGVWEDNSPTIKCYPQSLSNLPTKQEELATSTVEIPEKVVYLDPFYNTVGEGLITDPERPISPHRPRYKNDGGIAMPAAHPHGKLQ